MWRGEDVFKHSLNAVIQFCNTYAFTRGIDVVMTDSTKTTRREGELWIEPLTSSLLPAIPSASEETMPIGDVPFPENNAMLPADDLEVPVMDIAHDHPVVVATVYDADEMVLVRESSTADTLPIGDDKPPSPRNVETSPLNNT
ncbi:hypothetical protein KIN20_033745 [Parelaphostrongylus tenuis]|uniref:Uncharacterized protein n=1 Tax=Parelaphostrongylus tenuis TaxID=148309 RepID=A0AAD5R964_PARTN|nr:hypothetical protein KIN20_033745 [Parelaphostrongylus tenuis]